MFPKLLYLNTIIEKILPNLKSRMMKIDYNKSMNTNHYRKKVIIIGAGFAGYNAVRVLEKSDDFSITLIDRENHNLFQPMLYQVATGLIPIVSVAVPIRYLIRKSTKFIQGEVYDIDFQNKQIYLNHQKLSFDYLIICAGSKYQYFNTDWERYTLSLKTASDALSMKDHILQRFEQAEVEPDPDVKKRLLSFYIIGGGATGVEICGSLTDLINTKFIDHFHNISIDQITICVIEAGDRLLSSFSQRSSDIAFKDLSKKGGVIKLSEKVISISSGVIETSKAIYNADTIIWCVSLVSSMNNVVDESYTDSLGRIVVDKFLSMKEFPDIYCLGDASYAVDENDNPYPGLASVAKQQGSYAAKDIISRLKKSKRKKFHFKDYGSMAVISNHSAIAEFKRFYFHGRCGWYLWGFVHIYFLVNIKNKFSVFFNWMSYYFLKRPSSLIILNRHRNKIDDLTDDNNSSK